MRRAPMAMLLAGALMLAACADDDDGTEPAPDPPAGTEEPTEPEEPAQPDPGDEDPGAGDLPGEAIEIFPYEGDELGVMGVDVEDVLHVREGPGADFETLVELDPLAEGAVATGHNRRLTDGNIWAEVEVEGTAGWANTAFLTHLGQVSDITSELDELPSAPTLEEVGVQVAEQRASEEPPSMIVVVDRPAEGDLGEIVLDVVGLGDDAQAGERLHVLAEPGEQYTVRTVEATALCARGVTDGLCL